MLKRNPMFLKAIVWVVCVYHVALGIVLNAPVTWLSSVLRHCLGATQMPDASALFAARMLGTYMLAFGISMGLAAWNPVKNRALLTVGVLLVAARAVQRLVQADDLGQALGITPSSNGIAIGVLIVFAVALAGFRFRLYREMHGVETGPGA